MARNNTSTQRALASFLFIIYYFFFNPGSLLSSKVVRVLLTFVLFYNSMFNTDLCVYSTVAVL